MGETREATKTWIVVGPEVWTSPMTWEPPDPGERGHDVVIVAAKNRREARTEGVKAFRRMGAKYLDDGENPFAGLEVSEACCRHGVYSPPSVRLYDETFPPCPACDDEWDSMLHAEMHAYNDGLWEFA